MEIDNAPNIFVSVPTLTTTHRHRSSSLSNLPALRITTTSPFIPPSDSKSPILSEFKQPQHLSKGQSELTKLLAHHLSRLKTRPQPPSVFAPLRPASTSKSAQKLSAVVDTVRAAVRLRQVHPQASFVDDDEYSATVASTEFSSEFTYDYLVQLRDLLIISEKQGMRILYASDIDSTITSRGRTTMRRMKNSPQRPRSLSASTSEQPQRIELLNECIEILRTVISEDARFKNTSFRPTRPPYGLQAVSLDIVHILVTAYRHDPATLSRIGFVLIPAFYSFDPALHTRLFQFFEGGIIKYMLEELHVYRAPTPPGGSHLPQLSVQLPTPDSLQVPQSNQSWAQQLSSPLTPTTSSLSAIAPLQSLIIYQLSSLIPPLLAALLQVVDPTAYERDLTKSYKFYSLLNTIISLKEDAYLDLLEVIAYNDSPTRRRALSVLATYWPRALGHAILGKELPALSYEDTSIFSQQTHRAYARMGFKPPPLRDAPYTHEFIPWRFGVPHSPSTDTVSQSCHVCGGVISDFGLHCPFCFVAVHFNCYDAPHGTHTGQYTVPSLTKTPVVAEPQPCFFSFSQILPFRRNVEPDIVNMRQHKFRAVNLFTLCLCMVCKKPLWGYVRQGLKCTQCHAFVHASCVREIDEDTLCRSNSDLVVEPFVDTLIEFVALEQTFEEFFQSILFGTKELGTKQYEEIAVYYNVLCAQLHILDNGIKCKSIVVQDKRHVLMSMQSCALHSYCESYAEYLSSGKAPLSNAMQEYMRFNNLSLEEARYLLFDWSFLASVTSLLKTPLPHHLTFGVSGSNNLSPFSGERERGHEKEMLSDGSSHPYEFAGLLHLRNALSYEFHIHADAAVGYILSHIRQIGFFERIDGQTDLLEGPDANDALCVFSLPLGLDLSTSVETLVVAIEACLEDIDITVNEYGFLLLVRRFPPTGAASDYALSRLTRIIFTWIISEDERLIVLARDYIGRGLPGVRALSEPKPWPLSASSSSWSYPSAHAVGGQTTTAVNSGGEYVSCRRQLLARHALPWLAAVYELDPVAYANFVFEFCVEVGERVDSALIENALFDKGDKEWKILEAASKSQRAEVAFRSVIKLTQAGVLLSTFDQIIARWLDLFVSLETDNNVLVVKPLSRLFPRESEFSRRSISGQELNPGGTTHANDPWTVIMDVMGSSLTGLHRASRWLRIIAYSGVDVPDETLLLVLDHTVTFNAPLSLTVLCLESIAVSFWSKLFDGERLADKLVHVIEVWIDEILNRMKDGFEVTVMRRVHSRYATESRALSANRNLIKLLARIVVNGPEDICIIIAKFLSALVSDSPHIESQEMDNFILQNGKSLAQCAWRFYGLESHEVSALRITFLLRLVVVEPQPLEYILRSELRMEENWQMRFRAATKLFRILLDVNSPTFEIAGRQWGLSVSDIFVQFFSSLWLDPAEEVRLAIDAWSRTLLPVHLQKITLCWDEYMTKAPITDSMRLAASLVQLHSHFPSWQVLSWKTIIEVYNQTYESEAAYGGTVDLPTVDENVMSLRFSLVMLSLQMITNKIGISLESLVHVKFITVRFLGFSSARRIPTPNGQLFYVQLGEIDKLDDYACGIIQPLLRLLDASYKLRLPASLLGHWNQDLGDALLGTLFVDSIAKIWEFPQIVQGLPYVSVRGLLESLLVIVVKHDIGSNVLKHLDEAICTSIKAVADLIFLNSNYDIRQLCFAVLSMFLQTYPVLALRILPYQLNVLSRLVSFTSPSEDYLLTRAKEFVEAAFIQYEVAGLFWLLSKSGRMEQDLLHLLTAVGTKVLDQKKENMHNAILHDTFSQISANITDPVIANALYNLEEYVTTSDDHIYSEAVVQHFLLRLATIVRQFVDTSLFGAKIHWDPKPLLSIAITVFERTTSPYFDILEHVDTLLRASLSRYDISTKTLLRIFDSTLKYGRTEYALWASRLSHTVIDVLSDALRGKIRMQSSNVIAAIDVIKNDDIQRSAQIQVPTMVRIGVDAMSYFSLGREGPFTVTDFHLYVATAQLVLYVSNVNSSFITQVMSPDNRNPPSVRIWNLVTLASLEQSDSTAGQKLFKLLPTFSYLYAATLRFASSGSQYDHSALAVNHAFASVKLWLLLARKCHQARNLARRSEESDKAERQVWNELWPPFERLLVQTLENPNAEVPPLLTFVWGCVADLILFVRQAHSAIAADTSSHISILETLRAVDSSGNKFNRALRSIYEPPAEVDFETLRNQVASDVLTAEKLHAADTIRQGIEKRRENTIGTRTNN
ncbi:hypothetical protein Clacol_006366 [Clathrus columnatus]|uniref:Phorbol-ester/DAG-type domain-containing protein n=1 Tax=Clathrus columnatus TaxID=1419009 RepID=A0AAV5AGV4_9AGAM|nr:hypothetical protein Clacol_006366 [Clathrus columnatus]